MGQWRGKRVPQCNSESDFEEIDNDCTALGDLLECIKRDLLVFNLPLHKGSRPSASPSDSLDQIPSDSDSHADADFSHVQVTSADDVGTSQNMAPPTIITTHSDPKIPEIKLIEARTQTMNSSRLVGPNARILADEFKDRMRHILEIDTDQHPGYWYTESERVPPSNITSDDEDTAISTHLNRSGVSEVNGPF